jgi:hypothetical protein
MNRLVKARRILFSGALLAISSTWAALVSANAGEVSFTPTGLKISIMNITLSAMGPNGAMMSQQVLYTCPNDTEEECLVDITDQTALDAIAAAAGSATVAVGTYDTVSMNLCAAGKSGGTPVPGFVRGTFAVMADHKTYATDADAANLIGLKEVAADDTTGGEFTAIGHWSCSSKSVVLPTPVVITKETTTDLTIVVDPKLIAFSTPNTSPGMGGCRGQDNGQARGFCVSYPSIVSLVSADAPDLQRFLIAHHRTDPVAIDDNKANAYVVVVRGAGGGVPVTAFVRPYYSETSASASSNMTVDPVFGGPAYFGETLVSSVMVGVDGSVAFTTGGSLDGNSAIFQAFQLADHKGVVDTRELGSWQYHAIPLP